jgi:hypothetical protein
MTEKQKAGNSAKGTVLSRNPEQAAASDIWRGSAMKFSNGDVSLDKAVERNGNHIVLSNMNLLFDTSL